MFDIAARRALVRASGLRRGRVLDVGMGGCACMSLFLARKGFEVTGIDSSPQAVHEARQKAKKNRLRGRFEARRANAKSLPFQDGEFDAVIAFHSLHHVGDVQSVLKEMYRVCRRGGTILVSDFNQQGQKACDHERDGGQLLSRVEASLTEHTRLVRRLTTFFNVMFVCEK